MVSDLTIATILPQALLLWVYVFVMTVVMVNLLIAQVSSIDLVSPQKLYVPLSTWICLMIDEPNPPARSDGLDLR